MDICPRSGTCEHAPRQGCWRVCYSVDQRCRKARGGVLHLSAVRPEDSRWQWNRTAGWAHCSYLEPSGGGERLLLPHAHDNDDDAQCSTTLRSRAAHRLRLRLGSGLLYAVAVHSAWFHGDQTAPREMGAGAGAAPFARDQIADERTHDLRCHRPHILSDRQRARTLGGTVFWKPSKPPSSPSISVASPTFSSCIQPWLPSPSSQHRCPQLLQLLQPGL